MIKKYERVILLRKSAEKRMKSFEKCLTNDEKCGIFYMILMGVSGESPFREAQRGIVAKAKSKSNIKN